MRVTGCERLRRQRGLQYSDFHALILARGCGLPRVKRRPVQVGLIRSLAVAEPAVDLLVPGKWRLSGHLPDNAWLVSVFGVLILFCNGACHLQVSVVMGSFLDSCAHVKCLKPRGWIARMNKPNVEE